MFLHGVFMLELVMLIPLFVVGLIVFLTVDLKQPYESKMPSLEALMNEVQDEAVKEMRGKLVEHYGNEKLTEKKLNSYEELAEEITKLERKKSC